MLDVDGRSAQELVAEDTGAPSAQELVAGDVDATSTLELVIENNKKSHPQELFGKILMRHLSRNCGDIVGLLKKKERMISQQQCSHVWLSELTMTLSRPFCPVV